MKKTLSLIAAAAAAVTAIPASMAIPQAASAAPRVIVDTPVGGFVYNGRHYRHRQWRNNAWVYLDPYDAGYGYAPAYGYDYAPAPAVGVYYYGGRRYAHRNWDCHYNPHRGRVCKYRYW
jgi:hypothetical protein